MVNRDVVLRIPHTLGAAEAKRRLADGLASAQAQYGQFLHATEMTWEGDRLSFAVSALAQTVRGVVDVEPDYVELRAQLPLVLRMLAERFLPVVKDTGQKLLK